MSSKRGRVSHAGEDDHERILCPTLSEVTLVHGPLKSVGTINISRVQLFFFAVGKEIWIPYALIDNLTWRGLTDIGHAIVMRCRDFNVYTIGIARERDAFLVYQSIVNLLPLTVQDLDAVQAVDPSTELLDPGWTLYNAVNEYQRLGVGLSAPQWRISTANLDYSLCDTYPSVIAVPSACTDAMLFAAAKFRSRGRIPILSYLHPDNMGSITRCSQPLAGINQKRNADDEALVEAIFSSTVAFRAAPTTTGAASATAEAASATDGAQPAAGTATGAPAGAASAPVPGRTRQQISNLIVDARPRANAYANAAMGKGFENTENYVNCRREFLGIENIHVMRDSLNAMIDASRALATATLNPQLSLTAWYSALDASGWMKHMHIILEATSRLVGLVANEGANLLVHCSDGWDRTAQLTCLAMLCLDPYYRTIDGFLTLVDKEWLAFGHKFAHRLGHVVHPYSRVTQATPASAPFGSAPSATASSSSSSSSLAPPSPATSAPPPAPTASASTSTAASGAAAPPTVSVAPAATDKHASEMSPVFLQFLDCVYQIMRQHPTQFQFTGRFLRRLYRLAHASDTGTFLFNCERERRALVRQTRSAWTVLRNAVNSPQERPGLVNPRFAPRTHTRVLHLSTSPAALRFWRAMYCPNEGPRLYEAPARALAVVPAPSPAYTLPVPPDLASAVPPAPLWEVLGHPGPSASDEVDDPTLLPLGTALADLRAKIAWARGWLDEHGAAAAAATARPTLLESDRSSSALGVLSSTDELVALTSPIVTDRIDGDEEVPIAPLQLPLGQEERDEDAARLLAMDPDAAAAIAAIALRDGEDDEDADEVRAVLVDDEGRAVLISDGGLAEQRDDDDA